MIKSEYFRIEEWVPPETYAKRGEKAWQLIDNRLVVIMDIIRKELGVPITINNWCFSGDRMWSGLRLAGSPYFSQYSQHTFGRAVDFLVKGVNADDVRKVIRKLFDDGKFPVPGIRMELGVSWVHLDIANVEGIVEFYP